VTGNAGFEQRSPYAYPRVALHTPRSGGRLQANDQRGKTYPSRTTSGSRPRLLRKARNWRLMPDRISHPNSNQSAERRKRGSEAGTNPRLPNSTLGAYSCEYTVAGSQNRWRICRRNECAWLRDLRLRNKVRAFRIAETGWQERSSCRKWVFPPQRSARGLPRTNGWPDRPAWEGMFLALSLLLW
jgi:hypothetical protein